MKRKYIVRFFVSVFGALLLSAQPLVAHAAPTATSDGWGYTIDIPSLKSSKGIQTATSGDGWVPIVYNGKVYNIFHHTAMNAPAMSCVDQSTAAQCPGFPAYIDETAGVPIASTASSTNRIGTSFYASEYLDKATGKLYFAAQKNTTAGVQCVDLTNNTSCGYTALYNENQISDIGGFFSYFPSTFSGIREQNGKLYGVRFVNDRYSDSNPAQVYCFDMATNSLCSGYTYGTGKTLGVSALKMADSAAPTTTVRGTLVRVPTKMVGSKLYSVMNYNDSIVAGGGGTSQASLGSRLTCFDTTTGAGCSGWPAGGVLYRNATTTSDAVTSIFTNESVPGSDICVLGITATGLGGTVGTFAGECYSQSTGATTSMPSGFPTGITSGAGPVFDVMQHGTRSLFPVALDSRMGCYDWATSSVCSGFPADGTHKWPNVNGGDTRDYGYAYDEATECMWGLGDSGRLWSFSSRDFTSNCYPSGTFFFDAALVYCDLSKAAYDKLTLQNIDSSKIVTSTYTIIDQNGTPIPGFENQLISVDTPIDISSISVTGATQKIQVLLKLETTDLTPWQAPTPPQLLFHFKPDGQSRQNAVCTSPSSDPTDPSTPATGSAVTPEAPDSGVRRITNVIVIAVATFILLIGSALALKRFQK